MFLQLHTVFKECFPRISTPHVKPSLRAFCQGSHDNQRHSNSSSRSAQLGAHTACLLWQQDQCPHLQSLLINSPEESDCARAWLMASFTCTTQRRAHTRHPQHRQQRVASQGRHTATPADSHAACRCTSLCGNNAHSQDYGQQHCTRMVSHT